MTRASATESIRLMTDYTKHTCHECGGPIEYPEQVFGESVNCSHCGQENTLGEIYRARAATPAPQSPILQQKPRVGAGSTGKLGKRSNSLTQAEVYKSKPVAEKPRKFAAITVGITFAVLAAITFGFWIQNKIAAGRAEVVAGEPRGVEQVKAVVNAKPAADLSGVTVQAQATLTLEGTINPTAYGLSAAEFGDRVANQGNRVLVHQATGQGLVHVFERNGIGGYDKAATLTPPHKVYDSPSFGAALGVSGDNLLIGSHTTYRVGAHDGTAYRYRREAGGVVLKDSWTELPSQWAGYFTGGALKLSGDTLAVSQGSSPNHGSRGGVFVYRVDGAGTRASIWSFLGGTDRNVNGISLTPDTAYVSYFSRSAGRQLYAYTLQRDGSGNLTGVTTNAVRAVPSNAGGDCLAADGGWVALSDRDYTTNGIASGAVYLFKHTKGSLDLRNTILPPNPMAGARFGSSLLVKDGVLLVGSPGETNSGTSLKGCVYAYQINTSGTVGLLERHVPANPILGANEQFGSNMSGDGSRVAIASSGTAAYAASGAVYIYTVGSAPGLPPRITSESTKRDGEREF